MNKNTPLLSSPPVLQNPTPHSVTITWAVNSPSTGWIEYGPTAQLGQRADAPALGQHIYSERFISIKLTCLKPGQTIFYRTASAPVVYGEGSKVAQSSPCYSDTYQWTSLDKSAMEASFSAIN